MSDQFQGAAERAFDVYVGALAARSDLAYHISAALSALGRVNWIMPGMSFSHPSSAKRRAALARELEKMPDGGDLADAVRQADPSLMGRSSGKERWPGLECFMDFVDPSDPTSAMEGSVCARFGLESADDPLVRAQAAWRGDFLRLEAFDGGDFSLPHERPEPVALVDVLQGRWDSTTSPLGELGLDDDDYRFIVSLMDSRGYPKWMAEARPDKYGGPRPSMSWWFDFAEIDGEWTRLESQGWSWDGEWVGSTRSHSGQAAPSAKSRPAADNPKTRVQFHTVKDQEKEPEPAEDSGPKTKPDTGPEPRDLPNEDAVRGWIRHCLEYRDKWSVKDNPPHHRRWNEAVRLLEKRDFKGARAFARQWADRGWAPWVELVEALDHHLEG